MREKKRELDHYQARLLFCKLGDHQTEATWAAIEAHSDLAIAARRFP